MNVTFDNGVVDATALVCGIAAIIFAALALIFGLALRARNKRLAETEKLALKALEPTIRAFFHKQHPNADSNLYATWGPTYIRLAEKKYGEQYKDFWTRCLTLGQVPPIDVNTGELIPA